MNVVSLKKENIMQKKRGSCHHSTCATSCCCGYPSLNHSCKSHRAQARGMGGNG